MPSQGLKLHDIAILLFCVILAFVVVQVATQTPAVGAPGQNKTSGKTSSKTSSKTSGSKSSGNTVQWSDLVKGGKLPYGNSVTLTGKLSDLTCGANPISDVLDVTAIGVSYLGQTSQAATAAIAGSTWTAPLGSLPADTAVNLQLKITGKISPAKQGEIIDDLLADAYFKNSLDLFSKSAVGKTAAEFTQYAQLVVDGISAKDGPLTKILQSLLPSCVVVTEVTNAAIKGLQVNSTTDLLALPVRVRDLGKPVKTLDGYDPTMTPSQLYALLSTKNGSYTKDHGAALSAEETKAFVGTVDAPGVAPLFRSSYQSVLAAFGGDVIAQLNQGVVLSQSSATQDLSKYAGFDAGALYAPSISELRGYYMVHIYPFGPVELAASGKLTALDRWSLALGESTGDLSSNGASRVKDDKAFVYGVGFRINKYFRISAGSMLYRDTIKNRLLNEFYVGPSIDITALPGLKSVFASSSSKSTSTDTSSK